MIDPSAAVAMLSLLACLGACGDRNVSGQDGSPADVAARAVDLAPDQPSSWPDQPCSCALWIDTINSTKPPAPVPPPYDKLEIVVGASCIPDGTVVTLVMSGLTAKPTATLSGGKAVFKAVPVAASLKTVVVGAETSGCAASKAFITIPKGPSCQITNPLHLSTIYWTGAINVEVQTSNAIGGTAVLLVSGSSVGAPQTIAGPYGSVAFPGVTLSIGVNKLEVQVVVTTPSGPLKGTCSAIVNAANASPPSCTLTGPTSKSTIKGDGLGPSQDEDLSAAGLQVSFAVSTSAGATSVALQILKSSTVWTVAPLSGMATFSKITVPDGAHTFQATCTNNTSGSSAKSAAASYIVDTVLPPAIADLACAPSTSAVGGAQCSWTSQQDSLGTEAYDLRYLAGTISASNFAGATWVPGVLPQPHGTKQSVTIKGLTPGASYTFAVKGVDYLGNISLLSNVPAAVKVP